MPVILKYEYGKKPGQIYDQGYYYYPEYNNTLIGIGVNASRDDTEITIVECLARSMLLPNVSMDGSEVSNADKKAACKTWLESHGFTVSSQDESDADTELNSILLSMIRNMRDDLLRESDWTHISDSPLSSEDKSGWATYRQNLRDMPQNNSDITTIWEFKSLTWPTKPSVQ